MRSHAGAQRLDLHMHSTRSDGRYAPDEVLDLCVQGGLDVVAITDHDLSTDIRPGTHTFGSHQLCVIAGAEISGVHAGREYHLLVYFPGDVPDSFRTFCGDRVRERAVRYQTAVDRIDLPGLVHADDDAIRGERALTRHHLARALVDAGHANNVRDAFRRFADHDHGHVERVTLPFVDAIRIAREAGGITSWAHPPRQAIKDHLEAFVAAGLQGLEGVRPGLNSRDRKKLSKAAKKHGLFITGGSDWHGWQDERLGLFYVPHRELERFLCALDQAA